MEGQRIGQWNMSKISKAAAKFGKLHAELNKLNKEIEKARTEFLDEIQYESQELAQQVIFYDGKDPEHYVSVMYPKYRLLKSKEIGDDEWKLVLEEDPEFKSYAYVNLEDNQVYQRTIAESAPDIDIRKLREEDSELWFKVTKAPPTPDRILKNLDELTEEQRLALHKFLIPPRLSIRMMAPRKAKPEELEGN